MADEELVVTKKINYALVHKLKAVVSLLAFFVIMVTGFMVNASLITILIRSTIAILVVIVVTRVIIQMLVTYEELNSGKG